MEHRPEGQDKKALGEVLEAPELSVLPTFLHGEKLKGAGKGTPLERQVLDLQRQMNALSAESRSLLAHRRIPSRDITAPDEARELMRRYISIGMPDSAIVRRLSDRGVPPGWVEGEIAEIRRSLRKRRRRKQAKRK